MFPDLEGEAMSDERADWKLYVCRKCHLVFCCDWTLQSCRECGHEVYPIRVTILVDIDP